MNYVGSISILDRGDAPAQAVIDRNARSLAQRIADETKDELEKVMTRVETFFMENSKKVDEEDWFPTTPDMDLEEVGEKIEDSLQVAQNLTKKLGELNKEMIDFMANYAEKKASNKGKKKMEKALLQAKEEAQGLAEKLLAAQTELEEREEKLQATFKQLETKNLEVQKFRTAAELAKAKVFLKEFWFFS
nr:hypothetical protein BaRGS_028328 [Batillaria attramentaria]